MPHRAGIRTLLVAGTAAAGLVLAGCAETVSGHGAASGLLSPSGSDFPSSSPATSAPPTPTTRPSPTPTPKPPAPAPASHLACPHVVDGAARLGYDCISAGMARGASSMWPLAFQKEVDTGWSMDEGSGSDRGAGSPAVEAKALTQQMVGLSYGTPGPTSKTVKDTAIAIGKAQGHLIQTLITVNPTFRAQRKLRVKQEQLWLIVVPVAAGQLSAWYVSVPDLEKQLWPKVPALIKTLRVV